MELPNEKKKQKVVFNCFCFLYEFNVVILADAVTGSANVVSIQLAKPTGIAKSLPLIYVKLQRLAKIVITI